MDHAATLMAALKQEYLNNPLNPDAVKRIADDLTNSSYDYYGEAYGDHLIGERFVTAANAPSPLHAIGACFLETCDDSYGLSYIANSDYGILVPCLGIYLLEHLDEMVFPIAEAKFLLELMDRHQEGCSIFSQSLLEIMFDLSGWLADYLMNDVAKLSELDLKTLGGAI